jgi:hypothetical protein
MNKIYLSMALSFMLGACSISNKTKYEYEDIYDIVYSDVNLNNDNIVQQIKLREETSNKIRLKIHSLENENKRMLSIMSYDKPRNVDLSSMENIILKNKSLLSKYVLQLQKVNKEIEILKQKI